MPELSVNSITAFDLTACNFLMPLSFVGIKVLKKHSSMTVVNPLGSSWQKNRLAKKFNRASRVSTCVMENCIKLKRARLAEPRNMKKELKIRLAAMVLATFRLSL